MPKYLFKVKITHETEELLDENDPDYAKELAANYLADISSARWEAELVEVLDDNDPKVKDYE